MIYRYTGFITVAQMARSLNYSSQAIRKAIRENRLDAYVIGNQYMIKEDDVDRFRLDKRFRRRV